MAIPFGKHRGLSVEVLLLRHPDYVVWMLAQEDASDLMARVQSRVRQAVAAFDRRPFVKRCGGSGCSRRATLCSVYCGTTQIRWWCEGCNPVGLRGMGSKLVGVRTFADARSYIARHGSDQGMSFGSLFSALAQAKGLSEWVDESEARSFFREE